MSVFQNQKGIIQLGILGVLVLVGGLFLASKLVSNPDLTFYNIAEYAKGIEKDICIQKGKSLFCIGKRKEIPKPEKTPCSGPLPKCGRYEVINNCKCSPNAGHVPPCETKECSGSPTSGGSLCTPSVDNQSETKYCCPLGKTIANKCK